MMSIKKMLPALAIVGLFASTAFAQMPGGMQMSPEMQARMKAMTKFRDTHKNLSSLQQTLSGIGEMEKDAKTKLTKPQAKVVLGVLKTWRSKPVMTNAQALKVNKQITASMSVAQLKKIATAPRFGRRGGGARQPGGPGGPGGNRPRQMDPSRFPAPREYNPLNPDSIPQERMKTATKQRLADLTKLLTARAK